jgi:hypothetical protein
MNQNFDTFVSGQSDGVPLPVNLGYLSLAWGQNPTVYRIDRQAVASHTLCENGIGHVRKGDNGTG